MVFSPISHVSFAKAGGAPVAGQVIHLGAAGSHVLLSVTSPGQSRDFAWGSTARN